MKRILHRYWRRIASALLVAIYLKFLLIPTAVLFYELHHLTGLGGIYWGYSLFKAAGYYFGSWPFQTLACIGIAAVIATPWREVYRSVKRQPENYGASR